jgi:4-amino-4-deoxy-L-arabinose transferase-like glycosyltransferase
MTTSLLNILLQADGQVYNRSWIIGLVILIIVAGSWFAWHRNRKNVEKSKEQGRNPDGEVIV